MKPLGYASSRRTRAIAFIAALGGADAGAETALGQQSWLEALDERLMFVSNDGRVIADVSAIIDATFFAPDQPAPGLLFFDDDEYFVPRAIVLVHLEPHERLAITTQIRADRGFDAGLEPDGELRFDEYFADLRLSEVGQLDLRIGKFATVFGGWVRRHLPWDNPFVTAPAVYEDVVPITDQAAPPTLAVFVGRRNLEDNQPGWVPIVWGPSYTTGAALLGRIEDIELAVEVKNAAISSRSEVWDAVSDGFETEPTFTGRLGWSPSPEWLLGASVSRGPYMQHGAESSLPDGSSVDEFDQTTLGVDAEYEHYDLQLWAELAHATFEVPNVGDVDVLGAFVESKYKLTSQLWVAGRWNQSWADDAPGADRSWDRDTRRLDLAVGFRHTVHLQSLLQVSVGDQAGRDTNGEHVIAAQLVLRF